MTKEQLIAYLDAVCDAESAVQLCDETIILYSDKKQALAPAISPHEPTPISVIKPSSRAFISCFPGGLMYLSPVLFFVFYVIITLSGYDGLSIVPAFFLAICIGPLLVYFYLKFCEQSDYNKKEQEAFKQNKERQKHYASLLAAYDKTKQLRMSTVALLDKAIQIKEDEKTELQKRLNQLYDMNILYPSFRTLIAAYQIREYLQMGICETLEGPTGAYAQYMLDVRTDKICTSINDLKTAVTSAIYSLQSTLVSELKVINSNIDQMNNSLDTNFSQLNSSIISARNITSAQLDAHFSEANHHLSVMSQNISSAAHNQYIQQRLQNVENYLLRAPTNPA